MDDIEDKLEPTAELQEEKIQKNIIIVSHLLN